VGLTKVLGGGASSAVGQTGGVKGRCGDITGSLVLVLAVYRALSLLLSMRPLLVGGGCVDSAVRKILLPRKIYRTVTAPPLPPLLRYSSVTQLIRNQQQSVTCIKGGSGS
jgi:hypothetical protein